MMNWITKSFEELNPHELYAILRLRCEVFVVEQTCPYLDPDGKDIEAMHFMGWKDDQLVAYTRILAPGKAFAEPSIGRVVTSPAARKLGIGRELMQRSIALTRSLYNDMPIRIGAQRYLEKFYGSLGFEPTGEPYLEDGIPHIEMVLGGELGSRV